MTVDQFLIWQLDQETRYELVDGVPLEMMTGASRLHDWIVMNVIILLGNQLRGGPCRPTTADIALRTRIRSVRRPDVTVTCDPPLGDVYQALKPRMVVEVLSPSNSGVGWERKLREYRQHEALDYILPTYRTSVSGEDVGDARSKGRHLDGGQGSANTRLRADKIKVMHADRGPRA